MRVPARDIASTASTCLYSVLGRLRRAGPRAQSDPTQTRGTPPDPTDPTRSQNPTIPDPTRPDRDPTVSPRNP